MSFSSFLGNGQLKKNLTASLEKGHISHFYLISGPAGSGKRTLAKLLAGAILCQGREKPCGACAPCRKLAENNHPDVITVTDPEHKNVAVKIVRDMREDMFVRPNESEHKIYIFPQEMGIEGQNALLKILEEPPSYGVFILLADNPARLLPTVRSRCTELKLLPLEKGLLLGQLQKEFPREPRENLEAAALRSGGFLGQAREALQEGQQLPPQTEGFVRAMARRDALELVRTLTPMEKWKRDDLAAILQSWITISQEALTSRLADTPAPVLSRTLAQARGSGDLTDMIRHLKKALDYTQSNVSPAAVCGYLSWELR